jgi:putative redox protein
MNATARRLNGRHHHEVEIGSFRFAAGERNERAPVETPTPQELLAASLAACSTLSMEAYARRKGWEIGDVVVEVDYVIAKRGCPARCEMVVRLPEHLPEDQRRRLMSIAATSPMHRTLEGETMFDERLELTASDATAAEAHPASGPGASKRLRRRFWSSVRRTASGP